VGGGLEEMRKKILPVATTEKRNPAPRQLAKKKSRPQSLKVLSLVADDIFSQKLKNKTFE
jgi:hypothetical protein